MSVPQAVGWKTGETPTVPAGMRIQAMATGLMHPRIVYPLPNGDILVVEANGPGTKPFRPKDYIQGKVKARAGAADKGGNRITLLRDANGDGVPEIEDCAASIICTRRSAWPGSRARCTSPTPTRSSPFPYARGPDGNHRAGREACRFARRSDQSPLDQVDGRPAPDGSKLYVGVGSNSNITENGMASKEGRAAIYEVDRLTGAKRIYATGTRNPTNLADSAGTGQLFAVVNERDEIGPDLVPDYLTSIKDGGFYGWPCSYWGQHVDVRVHPQNPGMVARRQSSRITG